MIANLLYFIKCSCLLTL